MAKEKPTSLYLDEEARATLERLAEKMGLSRSATVRTLVMQEARSNGHNAKVRRLVKQLAELVQ